MSDSPQIRGIAPVLLVRDVVRAHDYFANQLGFKAPRVWGDPPHFCIPTRDGMEIMLNQVKPEDSFRPNADYNGRCDAYFWVNDADALYAEFSANGAELVGAPQDQPYGMREFGVRDPDGHLLLFGHDTTGTA